MPSPEPAQQINKPRTVAEAIEVVEATYELALAYASQGRQSEESDPLGIRDALRNADAALDLLGAATPGDFGSPAGSSAQATADMLAVLKQDIANARAALRFVLAQRAIGSQLIDNLNASIHIRALLTDIFLLDEAFGKSEPA
jgi:alkylation response protein AidB-like acyl-CoA dehydrogenase